MNHLTITPDPPWKAQSFTICYEFDSALSPIGTTANVDVEFDPRDGSFTTEFVHTGPGDVVCKTFTAPDGATSVTIRDLTGGAAPVVRFFV